MWITPPGGGNLRAELHGNSALDWGDLHIPLGRIGGGIRPVTGRKRCTPRPSHLLIHFREERNRRRLPAIGLHPINQLSSLERSGEGGGLQCSPTLSAAQESIAVSSGSDSGNATLPDGGSVAESLYPEPSSSPDAAIVVLSSAGAPNKMPCLRTPRAPPGTPDGAMRWRSERPAETYSTGKLSL